MCGPLDTVRLRGDDAEFSCTTNESDPVNWMHNENEPFMVGEDVKDNFRNKYKVTRDGGRNVLNVKNISILDGGKYTCIDKMGVGARAAAELIVVGKYYSQKLLLVNSILRSK